jgi:SAM-dependent methyltransferase
MIPQTYPRAAVFYAELVKIKDRFIVPQIDAMIKKFGDEYSNEYCAFLEKVLTLQSASGVDPVDAILDYTMTFLREQARFQQTNNYSNNSFDTVYDEVYNNPEVMEGFYLDGLLMTQCCWEIHYHIHRFFLESFVPRCKGKQQGFEIGFGHGLYLYDILELAGVEKVYGRDISPSSLRYATRLLSLAGTPAQFDLQIGDIQKGLDFADESMEFALMPEVIEHIHHPEQAVERVRKCLKSGAPLFVVTPMNSNAVDHITNFKSVSEIEDMITAAGFSVAEKKVFTIKEFQPDSNDITETFVGVFVKE